jgi:membrane fusion protein, heavy metal efflux system
MHYFVCFVVLALAATGCSRPGHESAAHPPAASVAHPQTEAALATVKLTADAVKRLGIETVAASMASAPNSRSLGGEIVVPEGRGAVVTAPVAGTLTGGPAPQPGARVRRGERLLVITPLNAVDRDQRVEAQRGSAAAEAEELAARQRVERQERLLKEGAASVRSLEEARAQHSVTVAALTAAKERLSADSRNPVGPRGELVVSAPLDGVVQKVSAVPGQTVSASAPLLELAQVDALWVRVPVYAGDARSIDHQQAATVRRLGDSQTTVAATRVMAPLQGDPTAASVDLYYAVAGGGAGALRPGERVLVDVPLTSSEQGLVIPDAAILYDIHGATWVYEDIGGNAYVRRRVDVARHAGNRVVIRRGIGPGTKVVTAGAAELFGTEFGAGH